MKLVWVLLWVVGLEVNAQNVGDIFGGISYVQTSITINGATVISCRYGNNIL
jgi:hypothetical protein